MTLKKILFVMPAASGGGAQRVMTILMKYLDRSRFTPHLVLITDRNEVFAKDIPPDVIVHRLHCQRLRSSFGKLIRVVWRIRPDVIFTTLGYLNIFVLMARPLLPPGTRIVIREANTPSASLRHVRFSYMLKLLYCLLYRFADVVICQTADIALELERDFGVKKKDIHIIVNPIDVPRIQKDKKDSQVPFPSQADFQLVAAGRLTYQKGFDILLLAFSKLIKEFPSVHLSIVGEGEERPHLSGMIRDLGLEGRVALPGFVSSIEKYLHHADLFILPSRWEGMPNVVLEALACGTPVVAMKGAGGVREIIKDGINGRLVSSATSEELALTIAQALKTLNSLRENAFLEPRFFVENVSAQYEKALSC